MELYISLWNDMKQNKNLIIDIVSYTVMITIYSKSDMIDKAELLWNEFIINNEIVNEAICCAMINCYSNHLMPHKAIEIMQYMNDNHIQLNITHYSSLIKCFLRLKQPNKALRIFNEIKANDIQLNNIAFIQLCRVKYELIEQELMKKNINYKLVEKYWNELLKLPLKYNKLEVHNVKMI